MRTSLEVTFLRGKIGKIDTKCLERTALGNRNRTNLALAIAEDRHTRQSHKQSNLYPAATQREWTHSQTPVKMQYLSAK